MQSTVTHFIICTNYIPAISVVHIFDLPKSRYCVIVVNVNVNVKILCESWILVMAKGFQWTLLTC